AVRVFASLRSPFVLMRGFCQMGNARTAAPALVVANNIPPLGPVHVAVAVGKGLIALIDKPVMADSQNVSYLVGDRHGRGGTSVMHDKKGFVRIRAHPG